MTVFVTGGAGFIGGNFIHYYLKKYPEDRVVCIDKLTYAGNLSTLTSVMDNPNFRFCKLDICDREGVFALFEEEKPDVVINFASESHNYNDHKVVYNDNGRFSFLSNPTRNPELNIEYQVLVDYMTVLSPTRKVTQRAGLEATIEKLKKGQNIKIVLSGDSIAAGAQTTGLYYFDDYIKSPFFELIGQFIEKHYNVECDEVLFGEDGVFTHYMSENIDEIIAENPDVVMIEFGMNDHVIKNAEDYADNFYYSLLSCTEKLRKRGIDVILIGFFQQNERWENENIVNIVLYNHTIVQIAEKCQVPYADCI